MKFIQIYKIEKNDKIEKKKYRISGIRADNFTPQKGGGSLYFKNCDKSYKKNFFNLIY